MDRNGLIQQTGLDYTWYEDVDSGQWVQQTVSVPQPKLIADYAFPNKSYTVDATIDITFAFAFADATTNSVVLTLPTAVGVIGVKLEIKRVDATPNLVSVITTGLETIEGLVRIDLDNNQSVSVVSDGTNWRII